MSTADEDDSLVERALAEHGARTALVMLPGVQYRTGQAFDPAAITRLEQTFDWVLWIEEAERKLVWSRAARMPWKQISGELGCDRTTAWRRWQLALTKIAARLNAQ